MAEKNPTSTRTRERAMKASIAAMQTDYVRKHGYGSRPSTACNAPSRSLARHWKIETE